MKKQSKRINQLWLTTHRHEAGTFSLYTPNSKKSFPFFTTVYFEKCSVFFFLPANNSIF